MNAGSSNGILNISGKVTPMNTQTGRSSGSLHPAIDVRLWVPSGAILVSDWWTTSVQFDGKNTETQHFGCLQMNH